MSGRLPPVFALREYALVADGHRGALVDPHGNVAWLCAPGWADAAVCAGLVGGGGTYRVSPLGRFVWGGFYEPGTLIWHSRWVCDDSILECRTALALAGDADELVLLRRLIAVRGHSRCDVVLDLRADFGAHPMRNVRRDDAGRWHGRSGPLRFTWLGAPGAVRRRGRGLCAELDLAEGEEHDLVLRVGNGPEPTSALDPARRWAETSAEWRARLPGPSRTIAPRDAHQALAVLNGSLSPSGGLVAAATLSLPERAAQARNYDYRYAWIRDGCLAGLAGAAAGEHWLLDATLRFARERLLEDGPRLRPVYRTDGGPVPRERRLDLAGYPGGHDVVGNRARDQFQLDTFGHVLQLVAAAAQTDRVTALDWEAAAIAAGAIAARANEPDAGIWELDPRRFTHSRLECAAGLRALARAPGAGGLAAEWSALADALVAACAADSLHRRGHWQRAPDDPRVDAALLLGAVRGAIPAEDPRSRATVAAVVDELVDDGYVYRFRHDERPLEQAEGAFVLCGFWMALALDQQGDRAGALRWFERSRAACGTPGLFSEEFDVRQRQLRGNLPQTFVHAALLECDARLAADPSSPR